MSVAGVLLREGLQKLKDDRYDEASRLFNAGLKFSPDNANLHFLNGLTYHLQYLRGDDAKKDFALTGYEMALEYDPAHYFAALQLGRLEFEARRYAKAVEAFRRAVDIEPGNGDAHHGLAVAAYYARDLQSARTAADRAAALLPSSAEATRAAAMVHAALDDPVKAAEAALRHAALEPNPVARTRLENRIEQWRHWHAGMRADGQGAVFSGALLAQISPPADRNDAAPAPIPFGVSDDAAGTPVRPWFDCGDGAALQQQSNSSYNSYNSNAGGDETQALPSLPAPCRGGGAPRMVVLDIAFIRSETNASDSHGINLLDGLTYVFNRSRKIEDETTRLTGTPEERRVTITRTRTHGLPMQGIAYSLNIANSTDSRAEVLANPSLVALDRMPSTFFSGSNVTIGIMGQAGGTSSITDRPVGVSLSVTPTFVDSDTVLLAVKAARSFVEPVNMAVAFGHTLQTSRNSVSANVVLKMGQTLILSGLSEQEVQRVMDGVPVLRDVPGLQYLFSTKMVQNFTRSVMVLITPRMPAYDGDLLARNMGHIDTLSGGKKSAYRSLIEKTSKATPGSAPTNLDGTYRHVLGNKLYLQFRSGDLAIQHWSEPPRLEDFFRSLLEVLYF